MHRMSRLQTLKPRITVARTSQLQVLTARPGTVERKRGSAGVKDRSRIKERDNGLCQSCKEQGRVSLGVEVDHKIPLFAGGSDDDENKWLLCVPCHVAKTKRDGSRRFPSHVVDRKRSHIEGLLRPASLQPSRIPLTIVCGPAAGGKSTYIKSNAKPGDIIIDMDAIRTELGIGINDWDSSTLERSLERRNQILASLSSATAPHAWFIISAASSAEREWWRQALQPVSVVVVLASERMCLDRIAKTRQGERAARSVKATKKWWREYTLSEADEVIRTG
jgi:5-methylcytosine-specific restriction endonuclease McrA